MNSLSKERDLRKIEGSRKSDTENKDPRAQVRALQRAIDGDGAGALLDLQQRLDEQRKEYEDEIDRLISGHESSNKILRSEYERKISELQKDMSDETAISALKLKET